MSTVDRLLKVLDLFTVERPDWSVDEAAVALGVPTSTVYRYFNGLTRSGLVTTIGGGRYMLGPAIISYDRQLRLTDPLVRSARGEMDRLARVVENQGVVFLCRLFDDKVMCVSQAVAGNLQFTISYERGRLMPLFAGSASRVILAHLSSAKIKSLHRHNEDEFRRQSLGKDWSEVRDKMRAIREKGSFVTSGEVDPGMQGISVPLVAGRIIGSLTIAGPRTNFRSAQIPQLLEELHGATRRIVDELYHRLSSSL